MLKIPSRVSVAEPEPDLEEIDGPDTDDDVDDLGDLTEDDGSDVDSDLSDLEDIDD